MKKTLLLIWTLLFSFGAFAQSNSFYYYKGKKKSLNLDKSKVNVFTTTTFDKSTIANITSKDFLLKEQNVTQEKWATIEFGSQLSDVEFYQKLNSLRNNSQVVGIGYHYKANKDRTVGTSNIFYVQLKKESDLPLLQQEAALKHALIIKSLGSNSKWYCLRTTKNTIETSVELANYFMETGKFNEIDVSFMLEYSFDGNSSSIETSNSTTTDCTNDPYFDIQWGLKNTTNPEFDINACEAWSITGANGNGVKVAVIDNGIKLDHPDIIDNIFPESYDTESDSQPSRLTNDLSYPYFENDQLNFYKSNHGMHVAGIIGAVGNNGIQTSGVAPHCKILGISNQLSDAVNNSEILARGFNWAIVKGADVINCSWFTNYYNDEEEGFTTSFNTPYLEDRIQYALDNGRDGKGCTIVFAAGNTGGPIYYPAYIDPRIMVVGAVNDLGIKSANSAYYTTEVNYESNNIDVVAPGVGIFSLIVNFLPAPMVGELLPNPGNEGDDRFLSGTSMAAPHVSGTIALMFSVNPCLTGQQARDIIEQTAHKLPNYVYTTTSGRPNGTWNEFTGYGLIDAHAAVLAAKQMVGTAMDFYIKDNISDNGVEPNTSPIVWDSPDIWVRNQPDGTIHQVHEQPLFNPLAPNYVYVKVNKKTCFDLTGNVLVKLYYAKPTLANGSSSTSAYRSSFQGTNGFTWELIGSQPLPSFGNFNSKLVGFVWNMPDPRGFNCVDNVFNTRLLAKIVSVNDPNAQAETSNVINNIVNNNNIAGKSTIVINPNNLVNASGNPAENSLLVSNPFDEIRSFSIELIKEEAETGKALYEEAEVTFKLDENLYAAWQRGGKTAQNIEITLEQDRKKVAGNNVLLNNVQLLPNEDGVMQLFFNFLTEELTSKTNYKYHFIQRDLTTNQIVGAATFEINKPIRDQFEADAGQDKEVDKNEPIIISAQDINEPALYNWYDSSGTLIYQGKELQIANAVAEKYKLEVIASTDGFKDYSEVEVTLKPSSLASISPNPVTNLATISYKLNEVNSAYLMVLGYYGSTGISNNYLLDANSSQTTLNFNEYPAGFYTVALVCNGQIVDAKTIIKQ